MGRLRGLLALIGIVAVVAGVPWLLLAVGQSPVPSSWPGLGDIWGALSRPDDGTAFVVLFRYAAWLAWLFFTLCLLLEIGARLVGAEAPDLPGLSLPQGMARSLVATAALLFIAAPTLTSVASSASATGGSPSAAPLAATTAVTSAVQAQAADAAASAATTTAEAAAEADSPDTVTHTIQPGETLWSIAEAHLGDGTRYDEIVKLNPDLAGSHWITPGATIEIPDEGGSGDDAADTTSHERTVQTGDTLWEIAEDELGDGERYTEIVDATGNQAQPDGGRLTDPDLIQPGWQVTIPGDDGSAESRTSRGDGRAGPSSGATDGDHGPADAGGRSADGAAGDVGVAGDAAAATAATAAATPDPTSTTSDSATTSPTSSSPADAQGDPVLQEDPDAGWAAHAVGLGGLTAAGVLVLLSATRRRATRRGLRSAPDETGGLLEDALRTAADGHSRDSIDFALRDIARVAHEAGRGNPGLRSVRLTPSHIDVQLDSPMHLPAPWTATADPRLWALSSDRARTLDVDRLAEVAPPFPALVTLGLDDEDAYVLVNLAHAQTFVVAGEEQTARATVAAMALDLASAPWADSTTVTVIGGDRRLVDAIGSPRLRHVADVDAYFVSPSVSEDMAAREVLLVSGQLPQDQADRLHQAAASSPRIALVQSAERAEPDSWSLSVGADPDAAVLAPALLQLRAQHADDAAIAGIVDLFALPTQTEAYWAAPVDELSLATVGAAAAAMGSPGVVRDADGTVIASSEDDQPTRTRLDELTVPRRVPLRWNTPVDLSRDRVETDTEALVETVRRSTDTGWTASGWTPRWLSNQITPTPGTPLPPVIAFPQHLRELAPPTDGPVLRLLGPVDIDNVPEVTPAHRVRLTELAAYLSTHPDSTDAELDDAMWPNRSSHDHSRVRESSLLALGAWIADPPATSTSQARQAGRQLVSDWSLWRQLLPGGADGASSEELEQALGLVRGRPFIGTRSRHYAWAAGLRESMIDEICAVAHELARRRLMDGRWSSAYDATVVGLTVEPYAEPLWRLQVLAAHELDDDVREAAIAGLRELGGSDETDLDPRSQRLLDEIADTMVPTTRGVG